MQAAQVEGAQGPPVEQDAALRASSTEGCVRRTRVFDPYVTDSTVIGTFPVHMALDIATAS